MSQPQIEFETIELLTLMINSDASLEDMIKVILSDVNWSMASEEQAVTFLSRLFEKIVKEAD